MKEGRGKGFSMGCHQWYAYGMQSSRTHPVSQKQNRLRNHAPSHSQRNLQRCASRVQQKGLIVPVTFHIPGALREFTAGRSKIEIKDSPATLADALSALWILYPGVRDR